MGFISRKGNRVQTTSEKVGVDRMAKSSSHVVVCRSSSGNSSGGKGNTTCNAKTTTTASGSGGDDTMWYKAVRALAKILQSIQNTQQVRLLFSLVISSWIWLASGFSRIRSKIPIRVCAVVTTVVNTPTENLKPETDQGQQEEVPLRKSNNNFLCQEELNRKNNRKMTIEGITVIDAMITPEQELILSEGLNNNRRDSGNVSDSGGDGSGGGGDSIPSSPSPVLRKTIEQLEEEEELTDGEILFDLHGLDHYHHQEEEEEDEGSVSSSDNISSRIRHLMKRSGGDDDKCSEDIVCELSSGNGSLSGSPPVDQGHENMIHHHMRILQQQQEVVGSSSPLAENRILRRRDSDTSDSSDNNSDKGHKNKVQGRPVRPTTTSGGGDAADDLGVSSKIVTLIESMFSDEHLAADGFLLKHCRRRSDGWVSLKLVAGLRKVKQLSKDFTTVLGAIRGSEEMEVNEDGTKIRRKAPLTPALKALPIKQSKKKSQPEAPSSGNQSSDEQPSTAPRRASLNVNNRENINPKANPKTNTRRASSSIPTGNNQKTLAASNLPTGQSNRKNSAPSGPSRRSSNVSTSSGVSSRNNSFSSGTRPHPADLMRGVMTSGSSNTSGEESPQVLRRRGGSLPVAASYHNTHRGSTGNYLSPNSSPPNASAGFLRPKSNSYCEGTTNPTPSTTMSPWLMKRKASAASSNGDIVISRIIREPRGPDGTKGFHPGYRSMVLKERLNSHTIYDTESVTLSA